MGGWLKWAAANKYINSPDYDLVVVADCDMLVSLSCYDIGLHEIAEREGGDIIIRDTPPQAEINGGFAMIRAGPETNGPLFMELLLEKAEWFGMPLVDQVSMLFKTSFYLLIENECQKSSKYNHDTQWLMGW